MSALLWMGVLLVIGLACVLVVGVITTHRRAQTAADLAALAGAQARQRGDDACAAATRVAGANGARLGSCRLAGHDVLVAVVVAAPVVGTDVELPARARAGPLGLGGIAPGDLS